MVLSFNCVQENSPGQKWQVLFNKTWPFYKQWFLSEGVMARKGYLSSVTNLQKYMPELMPVYEGLVSLAGGGDLEARFLSMYCPPPYMAGCSLLAWNKEKIFLIRNYDYNPNLFEAVLFHTHWLKPVIGMSDCNWGLLDGINGDGLSAALAFGGRKTSGDGFGIPLVIRYLLETTSTVREAVIKLKTLPAHMVYNITLADATGDYATVYLSPDRAPVITQSPLATNHQEMVEWPEYAALTSSVERKQLLQSIHARSMETEDSITKKFLQPPLLNYNYEKNFGTLYTVSYNITEMLVHVHWPGNK
ncbi:MAG: C45 family autoproteolytic acyltransferase/hydrolase, partial [Chitinophagaceae bacterium]